MCAASEAYCGVTRVNNVIVQLNDAPWPFATQNRENISAFWREKQESHPHFYDGQVHVMTSWEIRDPHTNAAAFTGTLCRTNFSSFLYWKATRARSHKDVDFSGGAALLCRDGAVLMVLSGDHTIAPGTLEFPSGFVDVSDFEDNKLNFDRHVEREVTEELAISREELGRPVQYLVSAADGIVQVFSTFIVDTNGNEFVKRWRCRAGALRSEISDVVAIHRSSELASFSVQAHAKATLRHLLSLA
jgi:8-oxo-dGTP pyrophosphatase MutT (NUDIX family)